MPRFHDKLRFAMTRVSFTHIAFADETSYNIGRFPGIALVSLPQLFAEQVSQDIGRILQQANVTEFKWERLNSAKSRFAALNLIDYAITQAAEKVLRVDVLTWDMQDGRHQVPKLDKIANLQRMYYHLFRNVLRTRWPDEAIWQLRPDEHTAMGWDDVLDYLDNGSLSWEPSDKLELRLKRDFQIHEIQPAKSNQEPLVQLADLFAGLGSYSRACYGRYQSWQKSAETPELSHSDRERCRIIAELDQRCKRRRLGVSLKTHHGLRTLNPKKPINFWWYIPQHLTDIAPTRS
jgi:hypothetical protein